MTLTIHHACVESNTCQAKPIIIYGPTWKDFHPWSDFLLTDLRRLGWSTVRDSNGVTHALMPLSMTEGTA